MRGVRVQGPPLGCCFLYICCCCLCFFFYYLLWFTVERLIWFSSGSHAKLSTQVDPSFELPPDLDPDRTRSPSASPRPLAQLISGHQSIGVVAFSLFAIFQLGARFDNDCREKRGRVIDMWHNKGELELAAEFAWARHEEYWRGGGEWEDCPFGNGISLTPDMLDMLIDGAPGTHTLMPATGAVARSQIIALPSLL